MNFFVMSADLAVAIWTGVVFEPRQGAIRTDHGAAPVHARVVPDAIVAVRAPTTARYFAASVVVAIGIRGASV